MANEKILVVDDDANIYGTSASAYCLSDFRTLCGWDCLGFRLVPDVYGQIYGHLPENRRCERVCHIWHFLIIRDSCLRECWNTKAVEKLMEGLVRRHCVSSHLSAVTWHISRVLALGACLSAPLLVARKIVPSDNRLKTSWNSKTVLRLVITV